MRPNRRTLFNIWKLIALVLPFLTRMIEREIVETSKLNWKSVVDSQHFCSNIEENRIP